MKAENTGVMSKIRTVAIAGNPNCGKTTLFNGLTGGTQRIGNWPGVTVERKEGSVKRQGEYLRLVDLPGIYSFHSSSEDERIAQEYLLSREADLVINILDASHLERNLFLTVQLIEMQVPLLVVLNMMDLAENKNFSIDIDKLSRKLGVPVCPLVASKSDSVDGFKERLFALVEETGAGSDNVVSYAPSIEEWIRSAASEGLSCFRTGSQPNRWLALKLLEDTESGLAMIAPQSNGIPGRLEAVKMGIMEREDQEADILIADGRYGFIHETVDASVKKGKEKKSASERIDNIVLNRFLGIPVFLGIMYLTFWVAISLGSAFIDFFDILFGTIFVDGFGKLLGAMNAPGWLITILAGGVGAGLQTVATFVPVVFFMFLMLSLLEDSGYMARAAFVMDRFMRTLGLPGKAFVPMIVGFGCTVPAIMATRTLESKRDRFLTIFITPMMSCGARLPVYALFGAAFFGRRAGGIVFSLYMIGILFALLTGLLLKRTLFKGSESYFVMELPEYHAPRFSSIMRHTWLRLKVFMKRAGKAIVFVVLVIAFLNSLGTDGSFGNEDSDTSVLSGIGRGITPIFTPMGIERDNWPATVGLFTGLFAKEVTVGTLNALYSQNLEDGGEEDEAFSLGAGIAEAFTALGEGLSGIVFGIGGILGTDVIGQDEAGTAEAVEADVSIFSLMRRFFTPTAAYAYLLFVLLYFPCVAAFGASIQEMGWRYAGLQAVYLTVLAWCTATLFYQLVEGHSVLFILLPVVVFVLMALYLRLVGRRRPVEKLVL